MAIKNILIVNQFGIGDVLFTFPMVDALAENIKDLNIGYLCNRRTQEIVADNPRIKDVFVYEKDEYRKLSEESKIKSANQLFALLGEIRKRKYDAVFDLSFNRKYGFAFLMLGIKKRIGYDYRNRGLFLTDKIKIDGYHAKHMVDYYIDLLSFLGIKAVDPKMKIYLKQAHRAWAQELFSRNNISKGEKVIGIIPGGGASWGKDASIKQWDAENFAKVAKEIKKRYNARIILLGSLDDKKLCAKVNGILDDQAVDLSGKTSLSQLAALLERCDLVVTNDGGPLHMAVAAGTSTVSIFGPVDAAVYGPYNKDKTHIVISADIACRPCYKKFKYKRCPGLECLKSIPVNEVLEASYKILGER